MISEASDDEPIWRWTVGAVLSAYATIYFSENALLGALVLGCTLTAPRIGVVGLAGLFIALAAAVGLGFERRFLRNGHYLFNSLLVSLAIAYIAWTRQLPLPSTLVLLVVATVATLLCSIALSSWMHYQLGLPPLSLPFVIVQLGLVYLAFTFSGPLNTNPLWIAAPEPAGLPGWLMCYLRSFGSIVFLPHATLGLAILIGVLCYSRLAILCATVGYMAGMATMAALPLSAGAVEPLYIAFNFLFCGMALGGVFFVPSWSSLLLAAFGSAACMAVAAAEIAFFRPLGFAPLALPFNVVILTLLYALRMRTTSRFLHAGSAALRPEDNFRRYRTARARFPHAGLPTISCPFSGQRVITQGVNGGITHRGAWQYALDFEVVDCEPFDNHSMDGALETSARRLRVAATRLEDNSTFNTPVLSPGGGVVLRTVADVEDRPIGASNFHLNWGNLVIIQLDGGSYVKLCHLRRDSVVVAEGQRVKTGELIGYCGNSGRSPMPHLHLQTQAAPNVGAATVPFRLRHYVESGAAAGNGQHRYHRVGIPAEQSRIRGAAMNDNLAALFDNLAYRRYSFRVRSTPKATDDAWGSSQPARNVSPASNTHRQTSLAGATPLGSASLSGGIPLGSSSLAGATPAATAIAVEPAAAIEAAAADCREIEDHVECTVDTQGNYVFRSSTGARLTACIVDKVFLTLDFAGSCDSVLFYVWLGLSQVPFIEDWDVPWTDCVDAWPLFPAWGAEAAAFAGPFAAYPMVRISSRLEPAGRHDQHRGERGELCVASEISARIPQWAVRRPLPQRIRVSLSRRQWIEQIQADCGDRTVTIEPVEG